MDGSSPEDLSLGVTQQRQEVLQVPIVQVGMHRLFSATFLEIHIASLVLAK